MKNSTFIRHFNNLNTSNQNTLIRELEFVSKSNEYDKLLKSKGDSLDERRAECPYCLGSHYVKIGIDKGSRRYHCKECAKTFTEYTGTWLSGLHKKEKIPAFLKTMDNCLSLVKSSKNTHLDPSTIFRWRHRFLSSLEQDPSTTFKGITESDETFLLQSQKGVKCKHRMPRSRSKKKGAGINKDYAAVLTTQDRSHFCISKFTNMGRISKANISDTIGDLINERTIMCSDAHRSYAGFWTDNNLEHHVLNASKKQRVIGSYHIQNVNSLHSRLKNLLNINYKGVSTKYLQKYLNWQKIKDKFKNETNLVKTLIQYSMKQANAMNIYKNIQSDYDEIYSYTLNAS